ncbi:MAG: MFS transporter, partial [Planctomycetaceae bacterium]|nr:MFS transporter [Planctomycetaceae bacterium]
MTRYHWFVLIVAALGWLFDCLDQQLFTLARPKAMQDLLGLPATDPRVGEWGGYATCIFILGWATGGLVFGALGDRIGRAKTMVITILVYSACTGLSSLSTTVWDFSLYRFLTGLGVGGEFAVGVALVAEVMPDKARPRALSLLQALSAIGNISAALIGAGLSSVEASLADQGISAWRIMFIIGALPALLALVIRRRLKEPERWQHIEEDSEAITKRGSYRALFADPRWRRSALVGLFLAIPGVIGLWGIGFFSGDLARVVFRRGVATEQYEAALAETQDASRKATLNKLFTWEQELTPQDKREKLSAEEAAIEKELNGKISAELTFWQSLTLLMQQLGAAAGMYTFGWLAQKHGRKPAFLIAYLCAMATTFLVFWKLSGPGDFWMLPLMGFFQLSLFALYAIYFPEIFPTYLRSTGTSFCYNVGRYVAAFGPIVFGLLLSRVFSGEDFPAPLNWRYAGMSMCCVFLIGIVTLIFAEETKDR